MKDNQFLEKKLQVINKVNELNRYGTLSNIHLSKNHDEKIRKLKEQIQKGDYKVDAKKLAEILLKKL